MRLFYCVLAVLAAALCFPQDSRAVAHDALLDGARLCTRLLPTYERQYHIPKYLLTAIAVTESGRWHDGLRTAVPWPWTVNAQGKGHYFSSKDEAIEFARSLRRRGVDSMDVGCMQVNLYHHPNAFASLQQAFEPQSNIRYAAEFLSDNYAEQRSWKRAAAAYHSKTPALGSDYAQRVHDAWKHIVAHVRGQKGFSDAGAGSRSAPMGAFDIANARDAASELPRASPLKRMPMMKVIEVKSGETPENDATATHVENGVKVTRAAPVEPSVPSTPAETTPIAAPASLTDVEPPADAAPAENAKITPDVASSEEVNTSQQSQANAVATAALPAPKVVAVDKTGAATVKKSGPRFIFD